MFIPLTSQAADQIIPQRYQYDGESSWGDVAHRVALSLDLPQLADLIETRRFIPNSPALANLGRGGFTHACLVRVIEDSYTGASSIPDSIAWAMRAHKEGAGTGFGLSRIRGAGESVRGTGGIASGPLSFLKVFDVATSVTKQGGFRRGANMSVLNWRHPDLEAFVDAKVGGADCTMACERPEHYHNFNLSIGVDADFWRWVDGDGAETWERIQLYAWRCGDPGLWFVDHTNRANPTPHLGDFESVNPCGETPLLSNESCVLGSLSLTHYLYYDSNTAAFALDYQALVADIPLYIRALDRMIDVAVYPADDIELATKLTRKVGLGMMGLADALAAHKLPYDSEEGRRFASRLTHLINRIARQSSAALGAELGEAPAFSLPDYMGPLRGHRNAIVTTQAPTGTISLIAGASAGIEPVYAVEAESHRYLNPDDPTAVQVDTLVHPFYGWLREHGFDEYLVEFQEAENINWRDHIRMQAAVQEHIENAVSKTINLPTGATPADVGDAYRLAYDLGCKGVTVYVNESKGESPWQRVKETCTECGSDQAYRSEGCVTCPTCGSKCDL